MNKQEISIIAESFVKEYFFNYDKKNWLELKEYGMDAMKVIRYICREPDYKGLYEITAAELFNKIINDLEMN